MTRMFLVYWPFALGLVMSSVQTVKAQGLDKEQRAEVRDILDEALASAAPAIADSVIKILRASQASPSTAERFASPSVEVSPALKIVEELVHEGQIRDERARVGRALKSLIDEADPSGRDCGFSGGGCEFYRSDGSLDFEGLISCELRRQRLMEERQKLGKVLRRLISTDQCGKCEPARCETSSIERSSFTSRPHLAPTVLESPARYYRYVDCN